MSFKKFLAPVMSCCCAASSLVSPVKADNNHTLTVSVFAKDGNTKREITNCFPSLMFGHCKFCNKLVWAHEKAICLCGDANLSFFNVFNINQRQIMERAQLKLPGFDALDVCCEKCYNKLTDDEKKQSRLVIEDTTDWRTKYEDDIEIGLYVGMTTVAYLSVVWGYCKYLENSYTGHFDICDDDA